MKRLPQVPSCANTGTKAMAFGGKPMQRDTIFRLASITKPITGAMTMKLIEQGKLSLDEPVDRIPTRIGEFVWRIENR